MPQLCVTITEPGTNEALDAARRAEEGGAWMVEYRLDAMEPGGLDLARLVGGSPVDAIVTFRLPADGGLGRYGGIDEASRLGLLKEALELGAAYVDIEYGRHEALADAPTGRLIVSHHDFAGTSEGLIEVASKIESTPASVVKVVTMARTSADQFAHYEILRAAGKPTVAFAMGELGAASRLMCLKLGAPFTYAAPDEGAAGAPGQVRLSRMRNMYRADRISKDTAFYGVIGHPVGHSMSPAIHNAAFAAEGLDAIYLPFDVDRDPAGFVKRMHGYGVSGLSVTIPHKLAVMDCLDEIEPAAGHIGAVNTVFVREGKLVGTNTDLEGALGAIAGAAGGRKAIDGRRALVIGAGGAARAVVFGLVEAGARVTLTDIVPERADELARASGSEAAAPAEADPASFDIIANASPVGMHPKSDECPVDTARLREGQVVFDAVYNPLETRLLREARARGCLTVRGVEMFVGQGARQYEIWTGRAAPIDVMRGTVLEQLT